MSSHFSRRSCLLLAGAVLTGCAESREPLRRLRLNLTRDVDAFRGVVRAFAEREGFWVAERGDGDFIGDGMIQLEGWRSSIIIAKQNLGIRDETIVTGEDGMPRPRDMTIVYADDVFEASFYEPTLTIAKALSADEFDELVGRFTNAIVSVNVADVTRIE